ncbi:MAG: glycoside hydrolase family 130 protein [bacterium]
MKAKRTNIVIKPDCTRVLFRPFEYISKERTMKVIARVMSLSEKEVKRITEQVLSEFHGRHQKLCDFFLKQFEQVRDYLITDQPLSEQRKLLIGAYFTQEYSLESAALFNPSMIWHPDQSNLAKGCRRFILSLRATGEGHISSITFRTGVVDDHNKIQLEQPTRFVTLPEIYTNPAYDKALFEKKLLELGLANDFADRVMQPLAGTFTIEELNETIRYALLQKSETVEHKDTAQGILSLAQSNYEIFYSPDQQLSERIIFPSTPAEINGIEDARFVEFHDDDGTTTYYATYTAYDGKVVLPQLLETRDFLHFKINTLNGPEVHNKGMGLFPRKINGCYAMISRQDNENIYIMFSEQLHFWYSKKMLLKPTFPWEFLQTGNCGSPIETEAGWLVLSHGVGPMRKYAIGAFLLDLNDPARIIGRLQEPLISPNENEREGYVPNVVYSCGGQIHNGELIIPYAMSDYASSFAVVNLNELLDELLS